MDNKTKQYNYSEQKVRLRKALSASFYGEAIIIEYAIIDDRLESMLRHASYKTTNNKGESLNMYTKLNKLKSCEQFVTKEIRKRLPYELLEEIDDWRVKRNELIHNMMTMALTTDDIREIALTGNELMKKIDNASGKVNKYLNK